MAAPAGEHRPEIDHSVSFCEYVGDFIAKYGEPGETGVSIAVNLQRVRQPIIDLYTEGFLYRPQKYDAELGLSSPYTVDLDRDLAKLSLSAIEPGPKFTKPTNSAGNKVSYCDFSGGVRLVGVSVFATHVGSDFMLGLRVEHSRKIYPGGYVNYAQTLYAASNPNESSSELMLHVKCQVVYEKNQVGEDGEEECLTETTTFLDNEWPLTVSRNPAAWLVNFLTLSLKIGPRVPNS